MTWSADVPFPAEDMAQCRGCGAWIGWITTEKGKQAPVNPKGWEGVQAFGSRSGPCHNGFTLAGRYAVVMEPTEAVPKAALVVVFESHFGTCPKRSRFRRAARGRP